MRLSAGEGYDVHIREAKNDQRGLGRYSVIGNKPRDGSGVRELLDAWVYIVASLKRGECSKSVDRRAHCTACGWFLPRLGGRPSKLIRDKTTRGTTTNFVATDARQALRQLQVRRHPDIPLSLIHI